MRLSLVTVLALFLPSCSWMEEHHPINNAWGPPDLVVDSNPSYFGGVSEEREFVLTNLGVGDANVQVLGLEESTTDDLGGQEFHLLSPAEPEVERRLETHEELSLSVRYDPEDDRPDRAVLRVVTNDPKYFDGILEIELIVGQPPDEEFAGPGPFDSIAPRVLDMRPVRGTSSNDGVTKPFRINVRAQCSGGATVLRQSGRAGRARRPVFHALTEQRAPNRPSRTGTEAHGVSLPRGDKPPRPGPPR